MSKLLPNLELDAVTDPVVESAPTAGLRLPAEILADIIELAILTASPCPLVLPPTLCVPGATPESPESPFSTRLRGAYTSAWVWTSRLLYVSKFFYSIARPLLLQTLTLDTDTAAKSFFKTVSHFTLSKVERAWLGNVSSLARDGFQVDPIRLRFKEAGWYEECPGGFIAGHAYASRAKTKRNVRRGKQGKGNARQYRSVSVYWAEEQLVEEISDPERSSSEDSACSNESEEGLSAMDRIQATSAARSLPLSANTMLHSQDMTRRITQRRLSYHEGGSTRNLRTDRPHELTWQTLYSRRQRNSYSFHRTRDQTGSSRMSDPSGSGQTGPSEGDLDPWDMQDAQERLAAVANSSAELAEHTVLDTIGALSLPLSPDQPSSFSSATAIPGTTHDKVRHFHRCREIYAYHLCIATLEPWINALFSSLRSLQLITITFYPGHLLDDDKLEHMLRRILSPFESPRLRTLLIRIVFDAASAGSRLRRFERTKTIAGAVDRIGDERVRVMLVNNRVGEGELVASPNRQGTGERKEVSPMSRKAITLTKEGWWARVLKQNHLPQVVGVCAKEQVQVQNKVERQEQELSNWQMLFPPSQHGNPTHLVNLIHHCDAWPDHPNPIV